MNYFIVFQNATYKEEIESGFLWAPTTNKEGGKPKFFWESMTLCNPGDIVYSVVNNRIVAKGKIQTKAEINENPFYTDQWGRLGWRIEVLYDTIADGPKISDYIEEIREMLPDKYSPFNKITGRGNQGYLFEISNSLGEYLSNLLNKADDDSFEDLFQISPEDEMMIEALLKDAHLSEGEIKILEEAPPSVSNKPLVQKRKVYYTKVDYVEKAKNNTVKGFFAEKLVVSHEKDYLRSLGLMELADKVKHLAKEADGYGYDVLSFDEYGNEKFIEVKGTSLGYLAPFEISKNEVETSIEKKDNYWIYRVFDIESEQPKFYKLKGQVDELLELVPTSFKAYFK